MIIIKHLGLQDYTAVWEQMKQFTQARISSAHEDVNALFNTAHGSSAKNDSQQLSYEQGEKQYEHRSVQSVHEDVNALFNTAHGSSAKNQDEIWMVQHFPVYTQGQAGKPEHILFPSEIPVVQTDRGGQITYHGPGQIVSYILLNLKHYHLNVRDLVCLQERAVITLLKQYNIEANGSREAPGIYVSGQKIASIGLRIKQGYSYHGLALNVDMDLSPFQSIRPCGLQNMQMTQMKAHAPHINFKTVEQELSDILIHLLDNVRK